jgi:hemerythrin-like domain-containing protein
MSNQTEGIFAVSLVAIHNVITRGLKVSIESAGKFAGHGFADATEQAGFLNYVRALVSVLDGHHLTEDDVAFPYFRDKLPEAPFDLLSAQHREMVPLLGEIRTAVERCEKADQVEAGLRDMEAGLSWVDGMWHPHIQIEQEHLVEKAGALLSVEEQMNLVRLLGEHSQKHSGPPYLTVPFTLYNVPAQERTVFTKAMPAEVTGHLVPIVWKEQWASMAPFLLE